MSVVDIELGAGIVNSSKANTHVAGEHVAEVVSIRDAGPNKFNPEKNQFEFKFNLEDGASTTKWVNKSFGFSQLNGYSTLAQLVQALTGIPCGDMAQRRVRFSELIGKRLSVTTKLNDKGYPNIVSFSPYFED